MIKFKTILRFLFLVVPFFISGGLELIILHNKVIKEPLYKVVPIPKKSKKELEKEIFANFMRRVTNENNN